MKKLLLFVFVALAFAACTQDVLVDITPAPIVDEAPETLVVGFEGDDTRIQLQNGKTVWTEGDLVSVFYKSDGNDCWKFIGETGERNGTLQRVSVGEYSRRGDYVIVAYPYNRDYLISLASNTIETTLPAVQEYATGSFGVGSSPMVAMGDYKQFALKNTCGWLKLQLTGNGEMVRSITLRGNNGEQVAGDILIVAEDASVVLADASIDVEDNEVGGSLLGDDDILKEVTLDCGEGVTLGAEATAFYIALPPQTFTQGLTVEITDDSGYTMTQATDKEVAIERNTIQPMAAIDFVSPNTPAQPTPANNQIWYTAKIKAEPNYTDKYAFGADVISNAWDSATGKGIITFDGNVTMVGYQAFYNCDNLITITLPDSVTTIEAWAFRDCDSLTSVNIPDSVMTIGESAFYYCKSLTSVSIPDSVTTIGYEAFSYCDSLTSVNIPDSVTMIEGGAFKGCSKLREFTGKYAADGGRCLIIDNTIIAYAYASGTTYNIPESVTTIGDSAFAFCTSLTSVNIPESVTTIGNYAFWNCDNLTSVNIPESVTTIGYYAFQYCDSLTSVNIPDSVTTIGGGAFYDCSRLTSVYCKSTTPPSLGGTDVFDNNGSGRKIYVLAGSVNAYKSATRWSEYADAIVGYDFENGEIVEVQPNNQIWYTATKKAEPWNNNAFGATIISNEWDSETGNGIITFDGNVTMVGNKAFYNCDNFITINLPDSVTTIGKDAFADCDSLTSVNIPNSVTTIGEGAFQYCKSLKEFTGKYAADGGRCLIIDNTIIAYANASGTTYNIPDSVTTIGDAAFCDCRSLTSVNIPDNVTTIGEYAFYYCTSLTSVNIPDSVTAIGERAFGECDSLTSVTIGNSVTTIGEYAFTWCSSLTSVNIPDSVTTIGNGAFEDCISLTSVNIPDSVTTIGDWAFYRCNSLTSVNIPDSVKTIGDAAFSYCDSLTSVNIPDSVTTIGERAFATCSNLREFTGKFAEDNGRILVVDGVLTAFAPAGITEYNIPDSVTTIRQYVFYECISLTSVNIPDSVTTIGDWAFNYCFSLTSVNIPESVTTIGDGAFEGCDSLKYVYCKPTTPPALGGPGVFVYNASGRRIIVPIGSGEAYKTANYWSRYANDIFEN